jgi:hypothetical protein
MGDGCGGLVSDEQRLLVGLSTAEAEASDGVGVQIELASNQAMLPVRIDFEAVGQDAGVALVIRTADEDDLGIDASGKTLRGPEGARGSGLLAILRLEVMGDDEAFGAVLQTGAGSVVEAPPDFGLPEMIEGLDLVLNAVLARGSEDGRNPQAQAEQSDRAKSVRMVVRTMEAQIVIELSIDGEAVGSPVGQHRDLGEAGGNCWVQETAAKPSMQRDCVEDLNLAHSLNDQTLDDIEGIQLGASGRDIGQVPTRRRRGATHASGRFDQALTLEHIGDGGTAGQRSAGWRFGAESAEDGDGSVFTQGVPVAQSMAQVHDLLHEIGRQCVGWLFGAMQLVVKVNSIETTVTGPRDPILDAGQSDPELACHFPQSDTTTDEQNQFAAIGWREFFIRSTITRSARAASSVPAPLRSASTELAARLHPTGRFHSSS